MVTISVKGILGLNGSVPKSGVIDLKALRESGEHFFLSKFQEKETKPRQGNEPQTLLYADIRIGAVTGTHRVRIVGDGVIADCYHLVAHGAEQEKVSADVASTFEYGPLVTIKEGRTYRLGSGED